MEVQRNLWPINELFARYGLAACIKAALQAEGHHVGDPIPPQSRASESTRREIAPALTKVRWKVASIDIRRDQVVFVQ